MTLYRITTGSQSGFVGELVHVEETGFGVPYAVLRAPETMERHMARVEEIEEAMA